VSGPGTTARRGARRDRSHAAALVDHERAFVVLRAGQRALLHSESEAELLDVICRIVVDEAGYRLGWVGFAEDDHKRTVRPVARAGDAGGYLDSIVVSWADTPLGQGPTGVAIRTGRPVVGRSFLTDAALAPWREEALRHGFASSLALPLRDDDRAFGALSIYATTPNAFSAADVDLLAGLADDLSFGITTLRARAAAEERLRRSERNLAEAQRIAHLGSWEWDLATDTAVRSEETYRIAGVEPGAFRATNEAFLEFVHPDDRARVEASERAAIAGTGRHDVDYRTVRPDGTIRIVHEQGELIRDPAGQPLRFVGTIQDITERVAADQERTRLALAVEQTADAVWMKDIDSNVTYVNRSFSRLYGYEPEEIVGRYAAIVDSGRQEQAFFDAIWASVAAGRTWTGVIVNRRRDGTPIEVEAVISGIRDSEGRLMSYMQTDRDVTRERALETALERDARERETIEAALAQIDRADTPESIAASACAEIVRLQAIDSAWAVGLWSDHGRILAAAGRIGAVLAAGNPVPGARARYLLERASTGPWAEAWQERPEDGAYGEAISTTGLQSAVFVPLKGPQGVVGVMGFGVDEATNAERIVERLPALATFGAIVGVLVAPGLQARYRSDDARASVLAILDEAAFTPFFQPIVEFHTGAVVGYEALSRFSSGIPPDVVFGLAGRAGLGIELEMATLRAALEAAVILPPPAYLSLNASPALVQTGSLRALLGGCQRPIVLEITEHVLIDDYPALRLELAGLMPNVRLAVDDAGAGYASLRHILELAPRFVKLDIGLIRGIDADPARQALIAGMGYFAVKRKLRLIAEGIETAAELRALRQLGINYGQGFLLGRPQDGRGPGPWPSTIALPASSSPPGPAGAPSLVARRRQPRPRRAGDPTR
jgi:PAS domain S-box-containing protein